MLLDLLKRMKVLKVKHLFFMSFEVFIFNHDYSGRHPRFSDGSHPVTDVIGLVAVSDDYKSTLLHTDVNPGTMNSLIKAKTALSNPLEMKTSSPSSSLGRGLGAYRMK